jgi:hypothetical protein
MAKPTIDVKWRKSSEWESLSFPAKAFSIWCLVRYKDKSVSLEEFTRYSGNRWLASGDNYFDCKEVTSELFAEFAIVKVHCKKS